MAYDASFKSNNIRFGGWELLTGDVSLRISLYRKSSIKVAQSSF